MSLQATIADQFERPHGRLGRLAGRIMARRGSNIERSRWTVELLQLEPGHRVLEIGCGPGTALCAMAAQLDGGLAVGLDHSALMIGHARHRLRAAIAAGKVELWLGGLAELEARTNRFDRIFSVNVVQFLPDLDLTFAMLRNQLAPSGRCATTFQPRLGKASRRTALAMAERIERAMRSAGFELLERYELPLQPAPAICVIGRRRQME
jgi:cyclopropane fatty-acyl-phospholipid synthase-like methyltransferase